MLQIGPKSRLTCFCIAAAVAATSDDFSFFDCETMPMWRSIGQFYTAVRLRVSAHTPAISISARPNVQTIVAPVGKSILNDNRMPSAVTSAPIVQPIARRLPIERLNNIAATDGTMRYEKTRSTPAIATDEVTTNPNDV